MISFGDSAFGGQLFPSVAMTDDRDSEINALKAILSACKLKLCLFHVA